MVKTYYERTGPAILNSFPNFLHKYKTPRLDDKIIANRSFPPYTILFINCGL